MNKKDIKEVMQDTLAEFYQEVIKEEMASKKDLDGLASKEELKGVKKDVYGINMVIDEIRQTQDAHTASLMQIEKDIKVFHDAWKVNKDKIDTHEEKIKVLEEKSHTHI